ncbi:hypothetical protein Btru_060318 [Bulinus truncatus]|nr:hypothetical protein Btru_060318 [Bulinus truncatus]
MLTTGQVVFPMGASPMVDANVTSHHGELSAQSQGGIIGPPGRDYYSGYPVTSSSWACHKLLLNISLFDFNELEQNTDLVVGVGEPTRNILWTWSIAGSSETRVSLGIVELKVETQGTCIDIVELKVETQGTCIDIVELKVETQGTRIDIVELKVETQGTCIDIVELKVETQGTCIDIVELKAETQGICIDIVELKVEYV